MSSFRLLPDTAKDQLNVVLTTLIRRYCSRALSTKSSNILIVEAKEIIEEIIKPMNGVFLDLEVINLCLSNVHFFKYSIVGNTNDSQA